MKITGADKFRLSVYFVLRLLVILVIIREIALRQWFNVLLCLLTLILFVVPSIIERRLKVDLPNALEIVILLFIFAAEILGEIESFYLKVPIWDTMLHTTNGFLMAAIGFALIDVLNRNARIHFNMSPFFTAFVAFCFSITVGVLWEFFEFFADVFVRTDMQKDTIVGIISSVTINPAGANIPVVISDISQSTVTGIVNGVETQTVISGGYLDLGLFDTMMDMLVNLAGAILFSVIGYFYIKDRGRGKFAGAFIPRMLTDEEVKENELLHTSKHGKLFSSQSDVHDEAGD